MLVKNVRFFLLLLMGCNHAISKEPTGRLVAIGDLHGDLDNALSLLELAKVIDKNGAWSGGDTILVQTGDTTDRGANSRSVMELMIRLQSEAQAAGGQVIPLLGNHEVMNTQGDWRYVHPEDITEFGSARDRQIALSPSGKYGKWLSSLDAVTVVQRTVFVHGGITPTMAKLGLDALNKGVHHEMFGSSKQVTGGDGPLWYRGFVQEPESTACPLLEQSLTLLDADRMVVGHTTQRSGVILSRCDGKLAVIDIGISDHYGSHLGYWESRQGDAIAVYPTKTVDIPDPRSE